MDLNQFKETAAKQKDTLVHFLQMLDHTVPDNLDALVREEDTKVWEKIDCTSCANCCKTMTPIYTPADIERIAHHFGTTPEHFFEQWLEVESDSGNTVNKTLPCPFLENNLCSIYDIRPIDCAEFPHHNKPEFDLYNETYIQNIDKCPATLELITQLKERIETTYHWE